MRIPKRLAAAALLLAFTSAARAEPIKIGTLLTTGGGPLFIALDKGYFAAEGLEAEILPFDAGQPVAVAAVSGAIDIGDAGVTSALYTFAGEGALKLIAGRTQDRPGFDADAVIASNRAYDGGLTSLKALGGHSMALTQIGSTFHYVVGALAERNGVDLKSMRILPLQSLSNVAAAITGGQADAGLLTGTVANPVLDHGNGKLVVWVGDVLQWQVSAAWTSTRNATERGDMIQRFLRALLRGTHDYYDAFTDADGKRRDGPGAAEALAILSKHLHQPIEQVRATISYVDREDRIDAKDIARQIAWYRAQGMLKTDVTLDQLLDRRYIATLPE